MRLKWKVQTRGLYSDPFGDVPDIDYYYLYVQRELTMERLFRKPKVIWGIPINVGVTLQKYYSNEKEIVAWALGELHKKYGKPEVVAQGILEIK